MKTALNIENVSCGYGGIPVLEGISLSLRTGEFAGLIGPNGSGKTTLIRAATGLIQCASGNVRIFEKDISGMSTRDVARTLSVVNQTHEDMFSQMTVEQIVTLGRIPHFGRYQFSLGKKDRDAISASINITDIDGLRSRQIRTLSGGEKQRVFISRALAQEPKILLLDEPTLHLDISHSINSFKIISGLVKDRGISALCVMHDLNLASSYCDRLILIRDGKVAAEGRAEEVLTADNIKKAYNADVKIYKGPLSSSPQILY